MRYNEEVKYHYLFVNDKIMGSNILGAKRKKKKDFMRMNQVLDV